MRKVELRMNEQEKYEVIKELVDHNGNKNRASKKLGISRRQVDRLIIKYKEKGKAGFVHGNRTRKPINALNNSIYEDIILLYKTKYQDWNYNHFKKEISQKEIVQFLINTDSTFKATYECYQGIINSLKDKDFNKFKSIIKHQDKKISSKMKQALILYNENIKYIEISFKYDINNGIIEGTNNLIKCLKRIAFGYRKFDHFIARIFLIKGIIKE